MADYYPLISRAVAGLEKNNGENRRALYERARAALLAQLRGVTPALDESDITRERLALEESIRKVEAEVGAPVRRAVAPAAGAQRSAWWSRGRRSRAPPTPASGKTPSRPLRCRAAMSIRRRRRRRRARADQMRRTRTPASTDARRIRVRSSTGRCRPSRRRRSLRSSRAIRCAGPPVSAARCPMPASRISATSSRRRTSSALRRRGRKSPRATPMPRCRRRRPISTGRSAPTTVRTTIGPSRRMFEPQAPQERMFEPEPEAQPHDGFPEPMLESSFALDDQRPPPAKGRRGPPPRGRGRAGLRAAGRGGAAAPLVPAT